VQEAKDTKSPRVTCDVSVGSSEAQRHQPGQGVNSMAGNVMRIASSTRHHFLDLYNNLDYDP
jgi:hypothetical protein